MKSLPLDRRRFLWCAIAVPTGTLAILPTLPTWLSALLLILWGIALVLGLRRISLPMPLRVAVTLAISFALLSSYGFRFGRDTGAALITLLLVLKLFELRSIRDARSAIGFSLFAAMAAFLLDQGPAMLLLSGLACLLLIAALAEIADLEAQPVATNSGSGSLLAGWSPRLRQSLRLLLLALPLAAVGFFLFPRLAQPLWGFPGRANEPRMGLSDEMTPGDIAQLSIDDSPAMRVKFLDVIPSLEQMYWRGPVLTQFDGRTWSRSRFVERALPEQFEALGSPIRYEVTQEPTGRHYVMALDVPVSDPQGVGMTNSRFLLSRRAVDDVQRFQLASVLDYRLDAEPRFPVSMQQRMTELPQGFNPRTRELIQRWRNEGTDDRAMVQRALALFNQQFTYTLEPELLGRNSVDDFLFDTRAGYCEHFSSAFTVMMRMAQIPARVVTGYQGAYYNAVGDHWVVRMSDAHAWSEVWLRGQGWVRVDPTSVVAPERIEQGSDSLRDIGAWGRMVRPLLDTADWLRRGWNDLVLGFDAARQQQLLRPLGIDSKSWRQIGMLLAVAAGIALLVTIWLLRRAAPPPRDPLLRAWDQFVNQLRRAGTRWQPNDPPQTLSERAARRLPRSATNIRALSQRFIAWRYAGQEMDAESRRRLQQDLRRFRIPKDHVPRKRAA
ncbi:MAG: DUF3488 and transglutaminase-like domain-containing protein [Lysobacteraceae bacterium]